MAIGSTAASPPRHVVPRPRSPFNPLTATHIKVVGSSAKAQQVHGTAAMSTRTHLSNLERFLQKQASPPPPPPPPPIFEEEPQHRHSPSPSPSPSLTHQAGNRLLKALNLPSTVFSPSSSNNKQTEELSPRSLARLLSNSGRPSPRGTIAPSWRRYHGAAHWDGLLDPLDHELRRELVRYGDFVQATYHTFYADPDAAPPGHSRPVVLPDRSYRVTRNLFATASVELPSWVDAIAPWTTTAQRTSWIGFVAVCDNEREIQRMGRRDIVIALRGTATCLEWAENFRTGLAPIDEDDDDKFTKPQGSAPKVECGFRSLYKTAAGRGTPSLSAAVVEEVKRLTEQYAGEEMSITVTGHSLGAALAVLVGDELAAQVPAHVPVAVFSFGGPRVGNRAFAERVEARGVKVLRVVNAHDLVTRVPGVLPTLRAADAYADVGRELRVDSRMSPYLRPDADPACCHDLEAYLHLVDGFIATNCPFRSDAKRGLARLLSHQGSNVKKLYVNKAREQRLQSALSSPPCSSCHTIHPSLSMKNVEVR